MVICLARWLCLPLTFRGILASPEGKFGVELETVSRRGCETAVKVQSVTRSIMCDSL